MKPLISPKNMRECELAYFASGAAKSIDVMERAAQALADAIRTEVPAGSAVWFACGTGGNGGDGTACARILHGRYRCAIVQLREPKHPDAIENLRRAQECGVPVLTEGPEEIPAAWVDALFGTGLSRAPEGAEAALIRRMNGDHDRGARIFAADIPSGLDGATGSAFGPCVHADRTVTFQFMKTGLTLADGLDCCGEITAADVGFPASAFPEERFDGMLLEPDDPARLIPSRPRNIHKGRCGHLLIVAGSFGMAGAAAMCASAALRSGAGLVTIACVRSIVPVLQTLVPQAMCVPLAESDGAISADALPALADALRGKSAAAIGPGLTRRAPADAVRLVLESGLPAVIDADALNLLAGNPRLFALLRPHHVITPHPGEAARLLESAALFDRLRAESDNDPEALSSAVSYARASCDLSDLPPALPGDPLAAARRLSDLGATALYKGASSVICGPGKSAYVSRSGCCGMARGGSGDILTGILGALLADRSERSPVLTAAIASELHGLAGELAQKKYGSRAMNARDILEFLPDVLPR